MALDVVYFCNGLLVFARLMHLNYMTLCSLM